MRGARRLAGLLCPLSLLLTASWGVRFHPGQESLVKQLSSYEIITPVRVNEFGEVFPHTHHFRRRKRSLEAPLEPAAFRTHYQLSAYGQVFQLNLSADAGFVSAQYTVVHVGSPKKQSSPDLRHCFYRGHVNAQETHMAVFSICGGLMGTFKAHDGEYILEPLMKADGGEHEDEHKKPHLIYRHEELTKKYQKSHKPYEVSDKELKKSTLLHSTFSSLNEESSVLQKSLGLKYALNNLSIEDGGNPHSRKKRFLSYPRYVEVMVTADVKMVRHHGQNLQHYILTLMSIVAAIYKDSSIGNLINIVIVKLIVIHNEQEGPAITFNAATTLRNFCLWQQSQNTLDDTHPSHHDTAVLITRFNVPHDDSFKCKEAGIKHQYHVMAPTLNYHTSPWTWSKCSQKYITEFLDTGYGECLLDKPSGKIYDLSSQLPGSMYDVNKQCELTFGIGSQVCPYLKQCKRLWCTSTEGVRKGCRTQHMPLADGTVCGVGMLDYLMSVIHEDILSERINHFMCIYVKPRNGGKYCVGRRMKFRSCNTDSCPKGKKDFREQQCSEFDGKHFNINGLTSAVRWVPKYSGISMKDRCKLFCRVSGTTCYYQLKDRVADGTPCGAETNDLCVQGLCRQAGCDHVLNSKARIDKCGICGGDNSSCKTLAGTFNGAHYGYNVVVNIPKGATNIDIRQYSYSGKPEDDNYLALSDIHGNFILNGNFVVSMSKREINIKGAIFEYNGSNNTIERINSTDRVEEELTLQVLCVGNLYNPDVRYSFNVPIEDGSDLFTWDPYGPWQDCSRMCQGIRRRRMTCIRKSDRVVVSDQRCELIPTVPSVFEECNTECELRWHNVGKSDCTSRCGPGYRSIEIRCMKYSSSKGFSAPVDDKYCADQQRPPAREPCHGDCVLTSWHYTEWSECSRSCARGVRTREAFCMNNLGRHLPDRECQELPKVVTQNCNEFLCPSWSVTEWSECPVTCGKGMKHRHVWCQLNDEQMRNDFCNPNDRPESVTPCELHECASWQVGPWGSCSVTCGRGYQMRAVKCVTGTYRAILSDDGECNAATRPRDNQCSVSCGVGIQQRDIYCQLTGLGQVSEAMCSHDIRPASKRHCWLPACTAYQWLADEWEDVTRLVDEEKAVDVSTWISAKAFDTVSLSILLEKLAAHGLDRGSLCWVKNWLVDWESVCSVSCGVGIKERTVECMAENGLSSDLCLPHLKPNARRICREEECEILTTCKDMQIKKGIRKDGEYLLNIKGSMIKIYCSGMHLENPKEYLTLIKGEADNFSEVYGLRLQNPYECPFNGSRRQDCACRNDYLAAGFTVFSKIRFDVASMQIKTTDFLFAQTVLGRAVPFATAGDCYSAARCPQGQFSINLTGTGLRLSSTVRWIAQGNYATADIHKSHDGTKIYGRCGGFCGKCVPSTITGLQVQIQ
ncbi:hypothetical protein BTVI_106621 [Pitangus sulphuratus]|nr:hypothetical protein BTVI_106621 [Pitangus sulphuratus]